MYRAVRSPTTPPARLFAERGTPGFIRSDNGPEFIAQALRDWLPRSGVQTLYIAPGAPWENAYSESLNSRLRDELLNRELFTSVLEAKVLTEDYRQEYNQRRPHSALGYQTPAAFAGRCRKCQSPVWTRPRLGSPPARGPAGPRRSGRAPGAHSAPCGRAHRESH